MNRKRLKLLKSLIAIVTAISINACCLMQAYALPEPSPDWWQAATVIVGGAAANGTVVISAPVIIGTAVVALGLCAGAWAVTHPAEFNNIVSDVKSRISSLLVGKDNSGMMVKVEDGIPYLDEDTLSQIAKALYDGGYLSDSEGWSPSDNTSAGTYNIDSLASATEVFDFICQYLNAKYGNVVSYDNNTLAHLFSVYPYLQNGNHFIFVYVTKGTYKSITVVASDKSVGDSITFPQYIFGAAQFSVSPMGDSTYNIRPNGQNYGAFGIGGAGLSDGYDSYYGSDQIRYSNMNGTFPVDFGKTNNSVQVDGDTVIIPEWAGDIKESIDDLGNSIKNYPIALPSGTAIPYIFPDTTPEVDIKTMVQDVPIPDNKPIPDIAEEGRTQEEVQNPDPDKPIETLPDEPLTESTLPSLKLPAALAQRFPFSLVSDINVLISKLSGTGEAPHFSIPVKIDIANIDTSIDVDLSMFSGAVSVLRPVILACAVLGIIRLTFKVINV